jgi:hypothetical protein
MKKSKQLLLLVTVILTSAFLFNSCVKKDFDDPITANVDPDITATHTIDDLKNLAPGTAPVLITTDIIIVGIVIADDQSGNFYKSIIIQDSTGGIDVQVDITNFHTDYPMGRRVFIKCKGLHVASPDGNLTLGVLTAGEIGRIPAALVQQYLVKGKWGIPVTPKLYNINDFNIPTNTLVKFESVEFQTGHDGIPYSSGSPPVRVIQDCDSNELELYTSTFANFALTNTPTGNGDLVGVYILYSGDGELQIRDLNDVQMSGVRCDGTSGVASLMPIDSVRMIYTGSTTHAPAGKKIKGIVISDYTTSMSDAKNIYVQDGTAGIQVRFENAHSFAIGTELEINISGQELSTFSDVLQVNSVPNGYASSVGSGTVIPHVTTIAQARLNYDQWESQVIEFNGVFFEDTTGTLYGVSGNKMISDGVDTIPMFSRFASTFSGSETPNLTSMKVTGILGEYFGRRQIMIRNLGDIQ